MASSLKVHSMEKIKSIFTVGRSPSQERPPGSGLPTQPRTLLPCYFLITVSAPLHTALLLPCLLTLPSSSHTSHLTFCS